MSASSTSPFWWVLHELVKPDATLAVSQEVINSIAESSEFRAFLGRPIEDREQYFSVVIRSVIARKTFSDFGADPVMEILKKICRYNGPLCTFFSLTQTRDAIGVLIDAMEALKYEEILDSIDKERLVSTLALAVLCRARGDTMEKGYILTSVRVIFGRCLNPDVSCIPLPVILAASVFLASHSFADDEKLLDGLFGPERIQEMLHSLLKSSEAVKQRLALDLIEAVCHYYPPDMTLLVAEYIKELYMQRFQEDEAAQMRLAMTKTLKVMLTGDRLKGLSDSSLRDRLQAIFTDSLVVLCRFVDRCDGEYWDAVSELVESNVEDQQDEDSVRRTLRELFERLLAVRVSVVCVFPFALIYDLFKAEPELISQALTPAQRDAIDIIPIGLDFIELLKEHVLTKGQPDSPDILANVCELVLSTMEEQSFDIWDYREKRRETLPQQAVYSLVCTFKEYPETINRIWREYCVKPVTDMHFVKLRGLMKMIYDTLRELGINEQALSDGGFDRFVKVYCELVARFLKTVYGKGKGAISDDDEAFVNLMRIFQSKPQIFQSKPQTRSLSQVVIGKFGALVPLAVVLASIPGLRQETLDIVIDAVICRPICTSVFRHMFDTLKMHQLDYVVIELKTLSEKKEGRFGRDITVSHYDKKCTPSELRQVVALTLVDIVNQQTFTPPQEQILFLTIQSILPKKAERKGDIDQTLRLCECLQQLTGSQLKGVDRWVEKYIGCPQLAEAMLVMMRRILVERDLLLKFVASWACHLSEMDHYDYPYTLQKRQDNDEAVEFLGSWITGNAAREAQAEPRDLDHVLPDVDVCVRVFKCMFERMNSLMRLPLEKEKARETDIRLLADFIQKFARLLRSKAIDITTCVIDRVATDAQSDGTESLSESFAFVFVGVCSMCLSRLADVRFGAFQTLIDLFDCDDGEKVLDYVQQDVPYQSLSDRLLSLLIHIFGVENRDSLVLYVLDYVNRQAPLRLTESVVIRSMFNAKPNVLLQEVLAKAPRSLVSMFNRKELTARIGSQYEYCSLALCHVGNGLLEMASKAMFDLLRVILPMGEKRLRDTWFFEIILRFHETSEMFYTDYQNLLQQTEDPLTFLEFMPTIIEVGDICQFFAGIVTDLLIWMAESTISRDGGHAQTITSCFKCVFVGPFLHVDTSFVVSLANVQQLFTSINSIVEIVCGIDQKLLKEILDQCNTMMNSKSPSAQMVLGIFCMKTYRRLTGFADEKSRQLAQSSIDLVARAFETSTTTLCLHLANELWEWFKGGMDLGTSFSDDQLTSIFKAVTDGLCSRDKKAVVSVELRSVATDLLCLLLQNTQVSSTSGSLAGKLSSILKGTFQQIKPVGDLHVRIMNHFIKSKILNRTNIGDAPIQPILELLASRPQDIDAYGSLLQNLAKDEGEGSLFRTAAKDIEPKNLCLIGTNIAKAMTRILPMFGEAWLQILMDIETEVPTCLCEAVEFRHQFTGLLTGMSVSLCEDHPLGKSIGPALRRLFR